jgi:hypothetical protein
VETKKAFKHAPERVRNAAAVAGTKYFITYLPLFVLTVVDYL